MLISVVLFLTGLVGFFTFLASIADARIPAVFRLAMAVMGLVGMIIPVYVVLFVGGV